LGTIWTDPRPFDRNGANFCFRVKTTVDASGASTEVTLSAIDEQTSGFPRQFGERWRS